MYNHRIHDALRRIRLLEQGSPKLFVLAASTANVADLTVASVSVDGLTLVEGDRLLLKDQTDATENGIYTVGEVSGGNAELTRATDMDEDSEVSPGLSVYVSEGTANGAHRYFIGSPEPLVIGTDNLDFVLEANLGDLASTAAGKGASLIGVQDSAGILVGATQEAVDAELRAQECATITSAATPVITTATAKKGECVQIDPSTPTVVITAPASPSIGWRFGVKNATADLTGWNVDGNTKNIEHPGTGVLAGTAAGISGVRTRVEWEYDGVQWTVANAFNIV